MALYSAGSPRAVTGSECPSWCSEHDADGGATEHVRHLGEAEDAHANLLQVRIEAVDRTADDGTVFRTTSVYVDGCEFRSVPELQILAQLVATSADLLEGEQARAAAE
jgi:hypothetical protein